MSQGSGAAAEVGSIRVLRIGSSQMFEQLTALDDEEHLLYAHFFQNSFYWVG